MALMLKRFNHNRRDLRMYLTQVRSLALFNIQVFHKQKCIPVGCVPSAAVAVCWRGVSVQGGVCQTPCL